MQISAAAVKELRERSGAGMMECKNALVATSGELEAALEYLRKSGAAKAAKKAGRIAAEGAVVVAESTGFACVVEINSETDFAANDENFTQFALAVATTVLDARPADVEALLALPLAGTKESVESARQQLILKIGENISIRRFDVRLAGGGVIGTYRHGKRIGVLVTLEGGDAELAKEIAMHVAASNPMCITDAEVPAELLAKEREIRVAQAATSGKSPEIVEKMITGQLRKFVGEISLLGQPFVKDPDTTVGKLLTARKARATGFVRYEVGEGIEKKSVDFAEEVKAQARAAD
ncbi:MAG: elongation factor Ts [Gammaproteobacteria bacterium]|nr:elongation factor Ts [Gammaproteobacteria bacterium]